MSLTVVCNDDQWSLEDVITNLRSTEEYQSKLQQRRGKCVNLLNNIIVTILVIGLNVIVKIIF